MRTSEVFQNKTEAVPRPPGYKYWSITLPIRKFLSGLRPEVKIKFVYNCTYIYFTMHLQQQWFCRAGLPTLQCYTQQLLLIFSFFLKVSHSMTKCLSINQSTSTLWGYKFYFGADLAFFKRGFYRKIEKIGKIQYTTTTH